MLNKALLKPFQSVPPFHIPYIIDRKSSFRFLILPISWCDKAHFRVRYGALRPPKWALLQAEMVHIAMRGNVL